MAEIFECSNLDQRKQKRSVSFSNVEVYYFDRAQGFICVPSQGGSTLGMQAVHWASEEFSVNSYQHLRLLERYAIILRKCKNGKLLLDPDQVSYLEKTIKAAPEPILNRIFGCWPRHGISFFDSLLLCSQNQCDAQFDESTEHEVKSCPLDSTQAHLTGNPLVKRSHSRETDVTEDEDERLTRILDCYFLPLLSIKKRRYLLRRAGLKTVDPAERVECQAIRISRDVCGCNCQDGVCLPTQCNCALNGIKCQVDRVNFPCPCTSPTRCQNPEGRIEFNPIRVRTHYLHTRMRLDIERKVYVIADPPREDNQHNSKRPRLDDACSSKTERNTTEDQPFGPLLSEVTSVGVRQSTIDNSTENSNDPLFNTTINGGCKDCEDGRYMHLLMQEFVDNRTEDREFQTAAVDPVVSSGFSTHSVELDTVSANDTTDLPSGDVFLPIVSETEESTTQQITELPVMCSGSGLTEIEETYVELPNSPFNGPSLLAQSFELKSCTAVSVSIPEGLTSIEPNHTHSELAFPFSEPDEAGLLIGNNNNSNVNETVNTYHLASLGKCTLEPISSLFASCSTITSGDPISPENTAVTLPINEESLVEACNSISPCGFSPTSPAPDPVCAASLNDDESASSSLDEVDLSITMESVSTPLFDVRNKCSELENSPRNSTPPSSPYLESVRA